MGDNDNQNNESGAAQAAPAQSNKKGQGPKRVKTWQEKLDNNEVLNELDDVKSEADYSVRRHLREQKERAAFELRKNRNRRAAEAAANGGEE